MKICFATNNAHKLDEVRQILGGRFELLSLEEAGFFGDIPETHDTIEENSLEKASYVYRQIQMPVFSDDSGLEIKSLEGRPGVHSAHYAGTRDAQANMEQVLKELEGITDRSGQFRTVITYVDQNRQEQFEGVVLGSIAQAERGKDGFGYDPIFIPQDHQISFAEMTPEHKNQISHRRKAVEKFSKFLLSCL